jgi:hypothetical protein
MTPQADLGIFAISVAAGLIGAVAGVGGGIPVLRDTDAVIEDGIARRIRERLDVESAPSSR